ncbi:MAG: NAD(+) synthase [Candidatus Woesearchaeota archaeon]
MTNSIERRILLPKMDPALVSKEIGDFVIGKVIGHNCSGGVIGLSGGVDSTTVAAVLKHEFDRYNSSTPRYSLELMSYMLPSNTNNPADTSDGEDVAKRLGIRYRIISIEPVLEAYRLTNPEAFVHGFDKGNLASRIRANILSTKAATEVDSFGRPKKVIGTGNNDEDFGVGYYTLFGDGAVHISPIGNMSKRLVRQMATYHGFDDKANRIPSAGLEPKQTDFGDLGYAYETVELVSCGIRQEFSPEELLRHHQVREYAIHDMELYTKEFGQLKFTQVEDLVIDIFRRQNIAQGKAEIIHPPIAPITLEYVDPKYL